MPVLGIGIDLVEVKRIRDLLQRHGDRFKKRMFSDEEVAYCELFAESAIPYAARFAAKEAAVKALGTGFAGEVGFADVEVTRLPTGQPELRFHGGAKARAEALGVQRSWVTLTHTSEHAMAQVLLEG
jgi:holo-[acyl-carrier protein] synthase